MSVPYLLIGASVEKNKEVTFLQLKESTEKKMLCDEAYVFDVPLNMKFGSFDDLVRTVDELPKHDSFCENVLRKIQRQAQEINPHIQFHILHQGKSISVDQYIRRFSWDSSRYPFSRLIRDNLHQLIQSVVKADESFRIKVSSWSEAKAQSAEITKNEMISLLSRDLIDVLTPNNVSASDFIETEHLTTEIVYVPRGMEKEWQKKYELFGDMVVPRSTKKFDDVFDKDGGSLWKVLILKKKSDEFSKISRDNKFIVRDFKFDASQYEKFVSNRTALQAEKEMQDSYIIRTCTSTYSDLFIAWTHLKAIRIFCEAVLRYGVPPNFSAYILKPINESKTKKLKKELETFFSVHGYKDLYSKVGNYKSSKAHMESHDEEFLPFVNLSLQPLVS